MTSFIVAFFPPQSMDMILIYLNVEKREKKTIDVTN
jgi:hypothetical protein